MNNTETLATFDTQDTGQINVRENRRDNQELTIETLATLDTGQINVREKRRGNQECTIQRHWQHCAHKTQDK